MEENSLKPSIRFKGFTDAWEQRKLSSLASMHARIGWQNLRTSEFLDSGKYMLITGTDFENGLVNYETCHYVEKDRYDQDKNIQLHNGSILITKDGTLGKVAYVQDLCKPATLNAGVFNVEVKDVSLTDGKYLYQYLKAPFLMDYVDEKSTGGTIKHLNQNILVDFQIAMPGVAEQKLIGSFFSNLDSLITLHQRKFEKLSQIKQSLLQSMFPGEGEVAPKIRFKGFTDAWEQRKLNEVLSFLKDGTHGTHKDADSGPLLLSAKNIKNGMVQWDESDRRISEEEYKTIHSNFKLQSGDVLLTIVGSIGSVAILRDSAGITFQRSVAFLRPNSRLTSEYLYTELQGTDFQKNLDGRKSTSAQPGVYLGDLGDIYINIPPKIAEQKLIGSLFSNLDSLITLHQRKCELLKNIKNSLLSKMFPN